MVTAFQTDVGSVVALAGGILVVSDTIETIRKIDELKQQLEAVDGVTWAVQLYVVRNSQESLRDVGVDLSPAAELGYTFAAASSGLRLGTDLSGELVAGLEAIVRAAQQDDSGSSVYSPFLLLQDGESASLSSKTRWPIRVSSTNVETGNTVDTTIQEVTYGFSVDASMREVDALSGRLELDVELSDVQRLQDGVPVVSDASLNTIVEVVGGGVYLVGSLADRADFESDSELFRFGQVRNAQRGIVDIWLRVFRIGGPVEKGLSHVENGERTEGVCETGTAISVGSVGGDMSASDGDVVGTLQPSAIVEDAVPHVFAEGTGGSGSDTDSEFGSSP